MNKIEKIEKKIEKLQAKAVKFQQKMNDEIFGICENLDYKNASRFSYNIDRLKQFVDDLNNFKIIKK